MRESAFERYEPVRGTVSTRPRTVPTGGRVGYVDTTAELPGSSS